MKAEVMFKNKSGQTKFVTGLIRVTPKNVFVYPSDGNKHKIRKENIKAITYLSETKT